jgi:predicted Zn-dependent protease
MPQPKLPDLPSKDQIAGSLHRHIWLEQFVLVLLYDRRFRFAFVTLFITLLLSGTSLLRIWRVTPEDFVPLIRISAIDYLQSLSLARTAAREAEAQHGPECLTAWKAAVANNPANLDFARGLLTAVHDFGTRRNADLAIRHTDWLLRLGHTNAADVDLAARTLHNLGLSPEVLSLLTPGKDKLTVDLQILYAQALLLSGDAPGFAFYLFQFRQLAQTQPDSEPALVFHAYRAGWAAGLAQKESQDILDQAKTNPHFERLAHRLQLLVSRQQNNPDSFAQSLEFLRNCDDSSVLDFIDYWTLLARNGRRAQAIENINANALVPQNPNEAVLLARAHFELGLPDSSRRVLSQYCRYFVDSEQLWLSYGNLLVDQRDWNQLLEAGVYLQSNASPRHPDLRAFGFLLQGIAHRNLDQKPAADEAFNRTPKFPITSPLLGSKIAETLQQLGYAEHARTVLSSLRQSNSQDPEYWQRVATTAFSLKDTSLLVFATASHYRLRPDSTTALQDYAAALLTTRSLQADAVKLTFLLVSKNPNSVPARINHATALAQNQRLDEAQSILDALATAKLSPPELNAIHLTWFEIHFASGDAPRAYAVEKKIDRSLLFPPELAWLDNCLKSLKERNPNLAPPPAPSSTNPPPSAAQQPTPPFDTPIPQR